MQEHHSSIAKLILLIILISKDWNADAYQLPKRIPTMWMVLVPESCPTKFNSNLLQHFKHFFEEGVENFNKRRFYRKLFDCLDLINIHCSRILLPKDIAVQGNYYSRILLTQGLAI